jgi:hypothetical protein
MLFIFIENNQMFFSQFRKTLTVIITDSFQINRIWHKILLENQKECFGRVI